MVKRLLLGVLILLGLNSCFTPGLAPVGKEESFQLQEDERRLWNRAEEEQKRLDRSGLLYEDKALADYVNEVAQRVVPKNVQEKGLSIQIKVIKSPLLNAFALPHGVIYIHTGLLVKMENEAQLAALLAHEITHATHRHIIQEMRNLHNTTALLATLQATANPFGVNPLVSLLGVVGAVAAVSGYSKSREREADREGLDLMIKAGYDPAEAPKLFDHLKKDLEEQNISEPFFFGTHPRLQERIDSYTRLLKSKYEEKKGVKGAERFMAKIFPLLLDNSLMDLSMGRFGSAQKAIERFLERNPHSARAHYYLGEVYRQRAGEGDREKAEREFRLAAQYEPSYPEPYKGLGLLYYKQGLKKEAGAEFERYLSLAPNPEDKGYIQHYLQEIQGKQEGP